VGRRDFALRAKIESRVRRLFEGRQKADDLDQIFLWLRTRSFGETVIRDIGDFVAHGEERDKGQAWGHIRNVSDSLRYVAAASAHDGQPNKQQLIGHLRASLPLVTREAIKSATGFSRETASSIVEGLVPHIKSMKDGKPIFDRLLSSKEAKLYRFLTSKHYVTPAYTRAKIAKSLQIVIDRNGLYSDGMDPFPDHVVDAVMIFAVSKMHAAQMAYQDGNNVILDANFHEGENNLVVQASSEYPLGNDKVVTISFTVLDTGLNISQSCGKHLLSTDRRFWDLVALEVNDAGLLEIVM